jgi:LDH2 family malate/lactate/ureidoglycolate dehydrogenase
LDRIKDGILNPVTKIDIIKETFTTAVLDANNGMGHVVSKKAMQMCIDKAKIYGMEWLPYEIVLTMVLLVIMDSWQLMKG